MTELTRPTVGLVSCYFTLFDDQMPAGFRQEREAVHGCYRDLLGLHFDVVDGGMLTSDAEGQRANGILRDGAPDVVVFAPTMAAPPSYAAHALAGLDVPLVVWNGPTIDGLPDGLTQSQATVNSGQVAAVMFANVLVREGRPFATITASPGDPEGVALLTRTVRAAAVASSLSGASVLRVGSWIPGYLDVESTQAELERLGVIERALTVSELNDAFGAVASERIDTGLANLTERGWAHRPGVADERSMRLALALGDVVQATDCGRCDRQLPLGDAALESRDRDYRLPRRLAPDRRGRSGVLYRRPSDSARARARQKALWACALLRVLHARA